LDLGGSEKELKKIGHSVLIYSTSRHIDPVKKRFEYKEIRHFYMNTQLIYILISC